MGWFSAPDYWLTRVIFDRALGAVYLVAFLVAVNQFQPLLGERGLQPAPELLRRVPFRRAPSIFQLHYSDRFANALSWLGVALSTTVVVGLPDHWPLGGAMGVWFVLWMLYLSIVNVGRTFYTFGWESLLLEAGFLTIFLGSGSVAPPGAGIWMLRWLLFRVEFGAGLIKLRGDRCWRDLTCLRYHHETQPLPNPLSWYFHHLPTALHKVEVAANHFAQLVAPWGLFAPQPVAGIAGGVIVVTQSWLVLSGNFSWLNVLTLTLGISAFTGGMLHTVFRISPPTIVGAPTWHTALVITVVALVVALSYWPVRNLLSRHQRMNASFTPLHLVNTYGAFGSITKERYEVIVEGTSATAVGPHSEWLEYGFRAKPGDPRRRPPQVAPYHLRLDWLMWFAALSPSYARDWFGTFAERLLEGDPSTLRLLRINPFPHEPPRFVRARLFRYRFTTPAERAETGAWWVREPAGPFLDPVRLDAGGDLVAA